MMRPRFERASFDGEARWGLASKGEPNGGRSPPGIGTQGARAHARAPSGTAVLVRRRRRARCRRRRGMEVDQEPRATATCSLRRAEANAPRLNAARSASEAAAVDPLRLPFAVGGPHELGRLVEISPGVGQARREAFAERPAHRGAEICHTSSRSALRLHGVADELGSRPGGRLEVGPRRLCVSRRPCSAGTPPAPRARGSWCPAAGDRAPRSARPPSTRRSLRVSDVSSGRQRGGSLLEHIDPRCPVSLVSSAVRDCL